MQKQHATPKPPQQSIRRACVLAALACTSHAGAAEFQAGDWTLTVGGNINAFYTTNSCSGDNIGGLALGSRALACGGKDNSTVIGNGLLPSYLSVGAKSRQDEYDVAALIGIGAAAATGDAISQNNVVDVRQAYLTFGNSSMGTVKLGRDYGLYGYNAIINDMTLLGVGAATRATQRGRVSLGHIGAGYAYVGTYGQFVYTTPSFSGLSVDVAVMSPVDQQPVIGVPDYTAKNTPQFQGRVNFGTDQYKLWLGGKSQRMEDAAGHSLNMAAVEVGGSVNVGRFGLLANYQTGKGLGILSDADQGDVRTSAYLVQGTYKATDRIKLGLGYGQSRNRDNPGTGLKSNANLTAGLYYSLTKSITLVAEIGETRSKSFDGLSARQRGGALGGILLF
ncbi:hypothetical protein CR3_4395 [Cupriavidus gilardii CR3]|uniref:Porin n=2 Tax=Cupriavidus gilardii TaxID=82541 RepID=A0A849BA92_9BURK|nr:hypothetical protein CR3_4395 [Cupriavidus gilardii CR3]KAB0595653.1 porin [Cupriavidus gilardii]NNH11044.1 porin [Cupriavidus gilardii]